MSAEWPRVRLGEVLRLDLDKVPVDASSSYPMVGVLSFGRGLFDREPIENGRTSYRVFYRLKPEHVVMSQLFGWEGALALSSAKFAGKYLSPQFPTFLCDQNKLYRQFLGWLMRRRAFWEDLGTRTSGMGDRRRTLTPDALFTCEIPLPPLSEQRRIVARIEELSVQIGEAHELRRQATDEVEALINAYRHQIFESLRTRYSPVRLDSVAQCRLGKMLDSRFKTGVGSMPYLRNANVQWDMLDLKEVYTMDFTEKERTEFALGADDILVCEGGDIGKAAIWNNEIPGCCYQKALHRVRCHREKALPRFILHHLFWAAHEGHWIELKTQTTIPHLTGVKLKAYPVFIPPLTYQRKIVAELDSLKSEINNMKMLQTETTAELDALLPAILDRAFKGEL